MNYYNIQGRKVGKATKDLHYRQEVTKHNPIGFKLTNSERNLYRKVRLQVSNNNPRRKRVGTNRVMRLLLILKRLLGI